MSTLSTSVRWICFGTAAFVVTLGCWFGLTPSAVANPWKSAPTMLRVKAMPKLPSVSDMIERDPFEPPFEASAAAAGFAVPKGVIPVGGPGVPGSLAVPNPGQPIGTGTDVTQTIEILGTLLGGGHAPAALATIAGQTEVLRIGDSLAGRIITGIERQGIVFADGSRLAIAPGPQTPLATSSTSLVNNAAAPTPDTEPSPSASPTAAPTPTPQAYYRPMNIPQPFAPPTAGAPPTIGPQPPPISNPGIPIANPITPP